MRREPKGLDFTVWVLLAAAVIAYLRGPEAAAWVLVGVWTVLMALLALTVGVFASLRTDARVTVRFGSADTRGALLLAFWGLMTALAFAYLAASGRPLFWLPALSLVVVVWPGSGPLLLDEYVQSLLARGAALAGGAALLLLPIFALTGAPGLDVALAALAVYALALEAYAILRLRG